MKYVDVVLGKSEKIVIGYSFYEKKEKNDLF